MAQEKKMVEYLSYQDRYLRGEYVRGSPEFPAVVLMPEGTKETSKLKLKKTPVVEGVKAQPHFAPNVRGPAPAAHTRDQPTGRQSDREP